MINGGDVANKLIVWLKLLVTFEFLWAKAATLVKRRARESWCVRKTPDTAESDDIACNSCKFEPTVITEAVIFRAGTCDMQRLRQRCIDNPTAIFYWSIPIGFARLSVANRADARL